MSNVQAFRGGNFEEEAVMASQINGCRGGTQLLRRGPGRTRRRANRIGACVVVVLTMAPLGCRKAKPTQDEIREMMRQMPVISFRDTSNSETPPNLRRPRTR